MSLVKEGGWGFWWYVPGICWSFLRFEGWLFLFFVIGCCCFLFRGMGVDWGGRETVKLWHHFTYKYVEESTQNLKMETQLTFFTAFSRYIRPSVVTYNSVLHACVKGMAATEGLRGRKMGVVWYTGHINLCFRTCCLDSGYETIEIDSKF